MTSMNVECQNCGSVVSNDFARVCGDNDGNVHHCLNCVPENMGGAELLRHGGAAYPDIEIAIERTKTNTHDL
jgi:hypothetical protein